MEKFLKDITKQTGKVILKKFGKIGVKYTKSHALDVVSEADLLANNFLVKQIKKKYPTHGIISEEMPEQKSASEYVWIIDPIDGTLNFTSKIPLFVVQVGIAKNGKMIMSALYDPIHKELYFAEKGKGAYLNGKRITCSSQKDLDFSTGYLDSGIIPIQLKLYNHLGKLKKHLMTGSIYSFGLSAMYVASGRRDWHISVGFGGVWDYAPPFLILQEAGCKVTNWQGQPYDLTQKQLVIANKYLNPQLVKVIKNLK